jgi:hypothetical protein
MPNATPIIFKRAKRASDSGMIVQLSRNTKLLTEDPLIPAPTHGRRMSVYFSMVDPTLPSTKKNGELTVIHTMSRLCVCVHAHVERYHHPKPSECTNLIKVIWSLEGIHDDSSPFETLECVLVVADHGLQ